VVGKIGDIEGAFVENKCGVWSYKLHGEEGAAGFVKDFSVGRGSDDNDAVATCDE